MGSDICDEIFNILYKIFWMFARLILSVWAGSGQFIAPSGPESREHRGQVSLSSPVSLRRPGPGHPPLKLPRLAPTVADWTRGAARRGAITQHFRNDERKTLGNAELQLIGVQILKFCENHCFYVH